MSTELVTSEAIGRFECQTEDCDTAEETRLEEIPPLALDYWPTCETCGNKLHLIREYH
jgi:hypothetical protein